MLLKWHESILMKHFIFGFIRMSMLDELKKYVHLARAIDEGCGFLLLLCSDQMGIMISVPIQLLRLKNV